MSNPFVLAVMQAFRSKSAKRPQPQDDARKEREKPSSPASETKPAEKR